MKIHSILYTLHEKGFTLVEALISLFILSIALTGTFAVIIAQVGTAHLIQENFIASGLAQEGIEVARNLRDSDWFAHNAFGTSLPEGSYRVQWDSIALLPDDPSAFLQKDNSGLYAYANGGTNTPYHRTLQIQYPSVDEIQIIVLVSWQNRTGPKSLSAEEHLYKWNQ